jgi:hypothetical protein
MGAAGRSIRHADAMIGCTTSVPVAHPESGIDLVNPGGAVAERGWLR